MVKTVLFFNNTYKNQSYIHDIVQNSDNTVIRLVDVYDIVHFSSAAAAGSCPLTDGRGFVECAGDRDFFRDEDEPDLTPPRGGTDKLYTLSAGSIVGSLTSSNKP